MERYSTNLTDKQWQFIEKIINPQGRKRKNSLRGIIDAIFYILKTSCQWHMLPKNLLKIKLKIVAKVVAKRAQCELVHKLQSEWEQLQPC